MAADIRVGVGYDIHPLAPGRKLRLGGVEVPFERGLTGHSDADVVLHAVTDALLGAAGLPDIGELFPDTDPQYKDAKSTALLTKAWKRISERGFTLGNIDLVIHAEAPKLSPMKKVIRESIAAAMEISPELISVKAKTNERMGPIGRGEAIACTAVALLVSDSSRPA